MSIPIISAMPITTCAVLVPGVGATVMSASAGAIPSSASASRPSALGP
eukprot:CAMPEP_0195115544 /NCGR_PEP_ID=MMETSP0448-20130528/109332_1 /TAXON_ID=66468 /ORGANISM="Heterocapsa triquestra, Strain CCMP 448" /LENGTH=47 /DNA_ID= /DNA_START= /DNA_END= /DNA_ORIENTATION=